MFMGKRLLAATALISLLMMMSACTKQVCYRDGERKPRMPFASTVNELAPAVGLAARYAAAYHAFD
ncbi:hypothetical protein [Microbulbifer sp. S227A]